MKEQRTPSAVDIQVGANVRRRREMLKLSQEAVGERLGITFQQIQKYEKASNRISASRLHQIAEVLQCDVATLFEGVASNSSNSPVGAIPTMSAAAIKIGQQFDGIADPAVRKNVSNLIGSLVAA